MPRPKIRKHETVKQVQAKFNEYFVNNEEEVIKDLLAKMGYDSTDALWDDEYHGRLGFDCGWTWLYTKNNEQEHEWFLDNNRIPAYVSGLNFPYNTQSTTVKEIQLEKALKDLDLTNQYGVYSRLD